MSIVDLLVLGASGFIGRALTGEMRARGIGGLAVSRRRIELEPGSVRVLTLSDYDSPRISEVAAGCRAAILLAGRAHVMRDKHRDPAAAFLAANRDVPLAIAERFVQAGGRRLVFVSSIAVNGVRTTNHPFDEKMPPAPVNDYGRSKHEGEIALKDRCAVLGLELVIVRPPLVYGATAPGQFGQLLRAARIGLPLPLGGIENRRDFIGVENLADLLLTAAYHPAAAGRTLLVSDGQETSTGALARSLYRAVGHSHRLLSAPPAILRAGAALLGRPHMADRLLDDLRIDSGQLFSTMGWRAPFSLEEGLARSIRSLE